MKYIDIEVELGKTVEDGNTIFGTDENISESVVEQVVERVMKEPTFRRGKLETSIYIHEGDKDGQIKVTLGLFDEWDEDGDGDGDVWGDSPEYTYDLTDFSL